MVDSVSKFFNSVYIFGWFYSPGDALQRVSLVDEHEIHAISTVSIQHGGVLKLGPNLGFTIQSIRGTSSLDLSTKIVFETKRGKIITTTLGELSEDRRARYGGANLNRRFHDLLISKGAKSLLDIGGRDRSKVDRSLEYPEVECTVLDILPSTNVDVVGDAHEMSSLFPAQSFDAVVSIAVFEHLAMPWRVVVEMNRIMKVGAPGFVYTHQTIGMHDMPWDFFRFSDSTWDALFNEATGFRVIDRVMDAEQFVIPFILHDGKQDAEKSAGFEGSAVLFEKVSEPRVDWPVHLSEIISTHYPKE